MAGILGIVNVTRDSFSDGGRWLEPGAAVERGLRLRDAGADVIDVGAESTHPDAEAVPVAEELRRLEPVVRPLLAAGVTVSVDTAKAEVMAAALAWGADWINDVGGMRDPRCIEAAAAGRGPVVVMFSRSPTPRAVRAEAEARGLLPEIEDFFTDRLAALQRGGVVADRVVLDPGMGFFLGAGPEPSLTVLRGLQRLQRLGRPLLVSVSRKSFLGTLTGRAVAARGAATLAAELWAAAHGVRWIRTHDVAALRDGLLVQAALQDAPEAPP